MTQDGTLRHWRATGEEIAKVEVEGEHAPATCMALVAKDAALVTGNADGSVRWLDAASGEHKRRFAGHTGGITALVADATGTFVASASADRVRRQGAARVGVSLCGARPRSRGRWQRQEPVQLRGRRSARHRRSRGAQRSRDADGCCGWWSLAAGLDDGSIAVWKVTPVPAKPWFARVPRHQRRAIAVRHS